MSRLVVHSLGNGHIKDLEVTVSKCRDPAEALNNHVEKVLLDTRFKNKKTNREFVFFGFWTYAVDYKLLFSSNVFAHPAWFGAYPNMPGSCCNKGLHNIFNSNWWECRMAAGNTTTRLLSFINRVASDALGLCVAIKPSCSVALMATFSLVNNEYYAET